MEALVVDSISRFENRESLRPQKGKENNIMAVFPLSISAKYVQGWSRYEAVREILSNAIDAARDGHTLTVKHDGKETLRVTNVGGARLDPKVLLLGNSTKRGQEGYVGQFGEGLVLALLAGTRAGLKMRILNRQETWTPKVEFSEAFGDNQLSVYTRALTSDAGELTVEIQGIDGETWASYRENFLPLVGDLGETVKTSAGVVLMDPRFRGKMYVKGIFVCSDPEYGFGYNFSNAQVDRDRKMFDWFGLRAALSTAWSEAMTKGTVSSDLVLDLVEKGAKDIGGISQYSSAETKDSLVSAFVARYGADAVSVTSMAEAREVENIGRRAVVTSQTLHDIISEKQGKAADLKAAHEKSVVKRYTWSDLTAAERSTFNTVLDLVDEAAAQVGMAPAGSRLQVVDFGSPKILGLYNSTTSEIFVARGELSNRASLLHTVCHEVAHDVGDDGQRCHEDASGKLLAQVAENLLKVIL